MPQRLVAIAIGSVTVGAAFGPSFNIATGPTTNQPASSYAAAGLAGFWNAIAAAHDSTTYSLQQLDGSVTNVQVWQYGGTELRNTDDPGTMGDDQQRMDHCLVTYTSGLETCLFFYDLQNGDYKVLVDAMMPAAPPSGVTPAATSRSVIRT